MTQYSDIRVALKSALAEVVREAVANGEYASDSEVINEAVLEWRLRRTLNPEDAERIGQLWDEGRASGPGGFSGMDEIKEAARRRLEKERSR